MCLSIPAKILEIKDNKAIADFNPTKDGASSQKEVDTSLVKDIKVGDYGIISNGFIIKKISAKEAEEIFEIIKPKEGT